MITGQKTSANQQLRGLANFHNDGNMKELATSVNIFFQQVAADLRPLDDDIMPAFPDHIPAEFTVNQAQVEHKLSEINIYKASGPDGLPIWLLRDFFLHNSLDLCAPSTMPQYVKDLFHSAGRKQMSYWFKKFTRHDQLNLICGQFR